jgi:hypothetical protein
MSRSETKNVTFTIGSDQLDWVDAEAERIKRETRGVHVSRSAIVRRAIDDARGHKDGGDAE